MKVSKKILIGLAGLCFVGVVAFSIVSYNNIQTMQSNLEEIQKKNKELEESNESLLQTAQTLHTVVSFCNDLVKGLVGKYVCNVEAGGFVICELFDLEGKEDILRLKCTEW